MKADTFRTIGWTSADAAGLSILAGLARPDEGLPTSEGGQGVINHAIRFTLQNSIILNQFIYPASHVANSGSNAAVQPPMGARFRLKAGVDISQLNPESRIIAQAMKDYGLIVADNGSNFFFSGASYAVDGNNHQTLTWNDNDIQDTSHGLKSLTFSDFEVVDLTPVVTGLSAHSGAAGTSVTITGQNFSGAAGHLQVFFGAKAATSVTAIDDGHIIAVAPTGTGTVDVRVQSGVTTAADSQNIKSTIFGYGSSAATSNDRFTYSTGTPPPPPPPSAVFAVGADAGSLPEVKVFAAGTGTVLADFLAYDVGFRGGVRVAVGDVTGDGVPDIVTAPGRGGGPDIRVWDGATFKLVREFMAYAPTFGGGVFVAAGDINGDHFADIITTPDAGGGPLVQVFNGQTNSLLQSYYAYAPTFAGGVRLAAGDINGDGRADVLVGAGPGGGPHVRVFNGTTGSVVTEFFAYDPHFTGGIYIAAGDVNGDGRADIVTGAGAGGGPHVQAFSGTSLAVIGSFFAYSPSFTGGVRVGVVSDNKGGGLMDIVTGAGAGGGPHTTVVDRTGTTTFASFFAFDPSFLGGVFVAGQ
jgi:hypothetical protein